MMLDLNSAMVSHAANLVLARNIMTGRVPCTEESIQGMQALAELLPSRWERTFSLAQFVQACFVVERERYAVRKTHWRRHG